MGYDLNDTLDPAFQFVGLTATAFTATSDADGSIVPLTTDLAIYGYIDSATGAFLAKALDISGATPSVLASITANIDGGGATCNHPVGAS